MEPQINEPESVIAPLKKVTPLSKYLALALFVALPFLGGFGYMYTQDKVVIEEIITSNVASKTPVVIEKNNTDSYLYEFATTTNFDSFTVIDEDSSEGKLISNLQSESDGIIKDNFLSWGSNLPEIIVKAKELSSNVDPDCDYGCSPDVIVRLDYYTYDRNRDLVFFFSEEINAGRVKEIDYVLLDSNSSTHSLSFIQSRKDGYCCDATGSVLNRVFEVDLKNFKTTVRENDKIR
jgi:hypothetical protein